MEPGAMVDFALRYTEAWCSQDPEQVASFFTPNGALVINDGEPAVGREGIADAARFFMATFPDLTVSLDKLENLGDGYLYYHWTLEGTSVSGRHVEISGKERWRMDPSGLIARSDGSFDAEDYARQMAAC